MVRLLVGLHFIMNNRIFTSTYTLLRVLVMVLVSGAFCSCDHNQEQGRQLDSAEALMNQRPDSALAILQNIDRSSLGPDKTKARYALLMSQALDKNYIDTTAFDVLQPAIDYYTDKGTPDERLKTFYYQGRIFQNRGDEENAMLSFLNAREISGVTDTLTLAHLFVAQGVLYLRQYKTADFVENNLEAAKLYGSLGRHTLEIGSYAKALNGYVMMNDRQAADSVMSICIPLAREYPDGEASLFPAILGYTIDFGSPDDIKAFLDNYGDFELDRDAAMDFARGYSKIGELDKAWDMITSVSPGAHPADSLKYATVKLDILERQGKYEEAFDLYRDYSAMLERYQKDLLTQDLLFSDKKHHLEMDVLKERSKRERYVWIGVGVILLLVIAYQMWVRKLKIEHENDMLKIQTLQRNLFESDRKQGEATEKIRRLFQTRFQLLDGLASSYLESKETGQEQKRIFAEVKESISNFSSDETVTELTGIVNGYNNGLMDHFRDDFPKLSKSQLRLALYLFCGFSLPSISIFTGVELRNVYVYKSRLKSVISGSDSPRRSEYLEYFE